MVLSVATTSIEKFSALMIYSVGVAIVSNTTLDRSWKNILIVKVLIPKSKLLQNNKRRV